MNTRPSLDSTVRDFLSEFFGYVDAERRTRGLDAKDVQTVFEGMALPDLSAAFGAWHDQRGSEDDPDDEFTDAVSDAWRGGVGPEGYETL